MFDAVLLLCVLYLGYAVLTDRLPPGLKGGLSLKLFAVGAIIAKVFEQTLFRITVWEIDLWLPLSLAVLVLLCVRNSKFYEFPVFTAGWIFNQTVVWANGGRMPVDPAAIERMGYSYESSRHFVAGPDTALPFLCDWLYFPYAGSVFSIGDILFLIAPVVLSYRIYKQKTSV